MKYIFVIFILSIISIPNVFSWPARDSISGIYVEILWPHFPELVGKDGMNEIHFEVQDEPFQLGETTGWLRKCHGQFCPSNNTKTFELNTFSDLGLLYLFPLEGFEESAD